MNNQHLSSIPSVYKGNKQMGYIQYNRISNTILDRDWFSARDHVGVQIQVSGVSNLNFL